MKGDDISVSAASSRPSLEDILLVVFCIMYSKSSFPPRTALELAIDSSRRSINSLASILFAAVHACAIRIVIPRNIILSCKYFLNPPWRGASLSLFCTDSSPEAILKAKSSIGNCVMGGDSPHIAQQRPPMHQRYTLTAMNANAINVHLAIIIRETVVPK